MEIDGGEIFMALLGLAFLAWAAVVAWIGHGIRQDAKDVTNGLKEVSADLQRYIVQTEARLARIETKMGLGQ